MAVRTLVVSVLLMALPACVVNIREQNIVIPKPGVAIEAGTRDNRRWSVEPMALKASDGVPLHGARFTKPASIANVLYFGGNGFVLSKHADFVLATYRELPVNVIVFDHRGYGANPGATSLAALYEDGLNTYDQLDVPGRRLPLIVHGHSLGSFFAGHVASKRRLDGLILESSATSTEEWIKHMAGWKRFLARIRIDPALQGRGNLIAMKDLDEPVLFVSGEKDAVTRPVMARELHAAAAVPTVEKRLIVVSGSDHMHASHSKEFTAGVQWLLGKQSPSGPMEHVEIRPRASTH